MDRTALEHDIARRLLDHIERRTTDMAEDVMKLPADAYSAARQREELDALFLDQPLVLCLSGALPEPETYRAVDILGTPVLLTRDADGQVHAFVNACRHRGVRLCDGAGEAIRLTCPFHAWNYGLDGRLGRLPVSEGFAGIDRAEYGLVRLEVAEGHGLIVGRLRPGSPIDIDEYLGPGLAEELAMLDFADWRPHGEPHVHQVCANWKVTLDTFRENYHFNYLHKDTLAGYAVGGVLTFDPFGRHLRNTSALKSIVELRERPEAEWGDVSGHFSYQYALFPNVSLTFDTRHIDLWQVLPVDETSSEVVHTSYLRPGLSEAEHAKAVDMAPWICETVVDGEDFWVAGRTEPGLRLGMVDHVLFGRNEPAPQHLHRGFEEELMAYRTHQAEIVAWHG
ncbi:Phenylpropionate dioxygenase, large terminal subunit [Parafrankia irregularis]|uniref:Phenylpropionate dioxygenase, large terminal subunit n=1 Tax=Parafrankia irregularis TaxID=795642 RepID=A0A0S4QHX6_9ACTN|nr:MULTISPECIES: SRPBCC family protein [Parafrankia]MBE3204049.1 Rieske 2Fe-2S domain-containing protein [Parafrankia sp. CH37]CUU55075.1 Phenylpropionate dioxygenase, large terminal subunit [Parafrankia irregularis]